MIITITGRKVNLRDNFKTLAQKKLSRFDRIFDENATAKVVVTVERNRQTVEITINSNGVIYRAESTDLEMNDALDQVMSALGRQIQMNLLEHQFFMFRNEQSGEINVVYRRKDGSYGLLEPDEEA